MCIYQLPGRTNFNMRSARQTDESQRLCGKTLRLLRVLCSMSAWGTYASRHHRQLSQLFHTPLGDGSRKLETPSGLLKRHSD